MNEQTTEQMIQDKGLTAPRLSPSDIDHVIVGEEFHVFPQALTTICMLHLANGFKVIGESACVSRENFNEEIGRKVARENARARVWPLEGYRLQEALYRGRSFEAYPDAYLAVQDPQPE